MYLWVDQSFCQDGCVLENWLSHGTSYYIFTSMFSSPYCKTSRFFPLIFCTKHSKPWLQKQWAAERTQNLLIRTPPHLAWSFNPSTRTYHGMCPAIQPPTILKKGVNFHLLEHFLWCTSHQHFPLHWGYHFFIELKNYSKVMFVPWGSSAFI